MTKKQELAVQKETPVATAVYDYGEDARVGFEGTKSTDLSVPFLQLLQANSPQVADDNPPGSRAGMLFNTVTSKVSGAENFLPVHTVEMFVEWVARDQGGGFVAAHEPSSDVVKEALAGEARPQGKIILPSGNELIQTHYVYGLVLDADGTSSDGFAVIGFTSTKIKVYRDWKTAMYMLKGRPPIYAFRARISTVKQKNEHGTFFNFSVAPLGATWTECLINPVAHPELWGEAIGFRKMVTEGTAKAAYETQTAEPSAAGGAAPF